MRTEWEKKCGLSVRERILHDLSGVEHDQPLSPLLVHDPEKICHFLTLLFKNYCKDYMESLYLYCSATTTKIIWKINAARPVTTFSAPDRISGSDLILAGRTFLHEQVFSVSQAFDNKISSFKKFDENVCALESGIGYKVQTNL